MEPLDHLPEIFNDEEAPLKRRIEAASLVLQHCASDELVDDAVAFLTEISKSDVAAIHRIESVKALARRLTPKVSAPTNGQGDPARWREQWIRRFADERRSELYKLGLWPAPEGWMSDLLDPSWEPPPGPGYGPVEPEGFGDKLQAARMKLKNGGQR